MTKAIVGLLAAVALIALTLAVATLSNALRSAPPQFPATGAVWFQHGGVRYQLSDPQAKALRSILASSAQYVAGADHLYTSQFFYVDGTCFYLRGNALKLNPERGAHWVWQGNSSLNRMSAWRGGLSEEADVRGYLHLLDPDAPATQADNAGSPR